MNLKQYVPALADAAASIAGTSRDTPQDYLEKDVILHLLLARITSDERVKGKLAFKGGTCLIKCYLNYPRFSVDLDFTWIQQDAWNRGPSKEVRDESRTARHAVRDTILAAIKTVGITQTNTIWGHNSEKLTIEATYAGVNPGNALVKFQVNFCDPIFRAPSEVEARSLLNGAKPDELILLDEELTHTYARPVKCLAFDPREIVAEKGRAILTRRVPKGRDVLDLFLLERDLGIRIEDHLGDVHAKTIYSASREGKYDKQLDARDTRLAALAEQDIRGLLLRPIDHDAFEAYRERVIVLLSKEGDDIARAVDAELREQKEVRTK